MYYVRYVMSYVKNCKFIVELFVHDKSSSLRDIYDSRNYHATVTWHVKYFNMSIGIRVKTVISNLIVDLAIVQSFW